MRLTNRSIARSLLAFATLLGVLMLAGCGSSAPAPDAGSDTTAQPDAPATPTGANEPAGGDAGIDLCGVLTLEEVAAAAGVEVTQATRANASGVSSCNYLTADGEPVAGNTYTAGSEVIDPSAMIEANAADGAEEISGLGDRAVLTGDENFPILMVLKGEGLYSISVLADNLDGAGKRQATIDLARLSLDRLP